MKYFSVAEFRCKGIGCCDHSDHMNPRFLDMIDMAREISGVVYLIASGHRCPYHNREVGSTTDNHPSGKAADIKCKAGPNRMQILTGLIGAGFKRIGIAQDFIHCDISEGVESCWLY